MVFLSAFLLFQVELIMAKAILPGFGGSYLVWGACVMFFQAALLIGYYWSHAVTRKLGTARYLRAHVVVLFLPLILFPLELSSITGPEYRLPFVIEVVWLLIKGVGPAFLVLSTTSIIAQKVLAASALAQRENPYVLYGVSNLGSFLGLLTYPFLVEPLFDLGVQLAVWQAGYVLLALLHVPAFWFLFKRGADDEKEVEVSGGVSSRNLLRWFMLGAAGTAMFLAVTNLITFDLASIPFFWVMPLSIYLLSFALNFRQRPWCPAWIIDRFFVAVTVGVYLFLMTVQGYQLPAPVVIVAHLLILFMFCMFCQKELHDSRPAKPRDLTAFYLALAVGGFAGSALVGWVIPLVVTSMVEYLAGLLALYIALSLSAREDAEPRYYLLVALLVLPLLALWPVAAGLLGAEKSMLVSAAAGVCLVIVYFFLNDKPRAITLSLVLMVIAVPFLDHFRVDRSLVHKRRNFYGIYRIYDKDGKRYLRHGGTLHGVQYLDPARQKEALLYYHRTAPAGELLASGLFDLKSIGIVGLGSGSLAVYSSPGQSIDFYELDPDNREIAEKYFTYLELSAGNVRYVFGDARLNLSRSKAASYDILIIDAFNSDSIPVHLLTVEAIEEYRQRLNPGGIILFHVSNRHLNLRPVIIANADALGLAPLYKTNASHVHPDAMKSDWMAVTSPDSEAGVKMAEKLGWQVLQSGPIDKRTRPWTDRYSNLLSAMLAN
jgi:spermidine synthase